MAHLLHEYLFGVETREPYKFLNPLEIYELTVGNDIAADDFLPIRWAQTNGLIKSVIESVIEMDNRNALDYLCKRWYLVDERDIQHIAASGSINCLDHL